MDEKKS